MASRNKIIVSHPIPITMIKNIGEAKNQTDKDRSARDARIRKRNKNVKDSNKRNKNGKDSGEAAGFAPSPGSGGAAGFVASPVVSSPVGSKEPEYAEISEQKECKVCSEPGPLVRFEPCGHAEACAECAARIKKCLNCKMVVEQKKLETGGDINVKTREELKQLEMKFQDLEDQFLCGICMERRRNVAFMCGHGACAQCTAGLETCHMCRTIIQNKIHLY